MFLPSTTAWSGVEVLGERVHYVTTAAPEVGVIRHCVFYLVGLSLLNTDIPHSGVHQCS